MENEPPQINPVERTSEAEKSLDTLKLSVDVKGSTEVALDDQLRYVIADVESPKSPEETKLISNDPTLGFEIITTNSLPTEKVSMGERIVTAFVYNGMLINGNIKALFVDRSKPAVDAEGKAVANFKGMRAGEQITPQIIAQRFGKDVSFGVSLTAEGKLAVSNADETRHVSVLGFGEADKASVEENPVDDFELSVAAAKAAANIEAELDSRTHDIIDTFETEHKEPLSVEEIKEIGEEGLVAAEVKEPQVEVAPAPPASQEELRSQQIHGMYEQAALAIRLETVGDMTRLMTQLEESQQTLVSTDEAIHRATADSLARLNTVIQRIEEYPNRAIQTEIRQTIDALYSVLGMTQRVGEGTIADIHRGITVLQRTIEERVNEAENRDSDFKVVAYQNDVDIKSGTVLASDILHEAANELHDSKELHASLNTLDKVLNEVSQHSLRLQLRRLEEVLNNSFSSPIDPNELANITMTIQQGIESEAFRSSLASAGKSLEEFIGRTHRAVELIKPQ